MIKFGKRRKIKSRDKDCLEGFKVIRWCPRKKDRQTQIDRH